MLFALICSFNEFLVACTDDCMIRSLLSLYRYITLSDPLPQNREVQEHYMAEHSTDERFIEHDKLTAELEGNANKWTEVRSRLRYYR